MAGPVAVAVVAAVALLDLAVLAAFHLVRPDVDPLTRPTSEYALGSFGLAAGVTTALVGVGALVLAWVLRRLRAGALVLAVFGAAKVVQAFFPIDAPGTSTTTGAVHNALGTLAFLALPLAAALTVRAAVFGRRTLRLLVAVLAVAAAGVLAADAVGGFGAFQRVYLVLCSVWMLLAAVTSGRAAQD